MPNRKVIYGTLNIVIMSSFLAIAFDLLIFEICYTLTMNSNQPAWRSWVQMLQHWGIAKETAVFLEAAGPFRLIIAQILFFCQPLFHSLASASDLEELGNMFEDPAEMGEFVALLKGENLV
jgi:hypothetical protein